MKIVVVLIASVIAAGCVSLPTEPGKIKAAPSGVTAEQQVKDDAECKLEADWSRCMIAGGYDVGVFETDFSRGGLSMDQWRANKKSKLNINELRDKLKSSNVYFLPIERTNYNYDPVLENPSLDASLLLGVVSRISTGCVLNAHSEFRYIRDSLPRKKLSEIVVNEISSKFDLNKEKITLLEPNIKKLLKPELSSETPTKIDFDQIGYNFPAGSFVFLFATDIHLGGNLMRKYRMITTLSWVLIDVSNNEPLALGKNYGMNKIIERGVSRGLNGFVSLPAPPSTLALQKEKSLSLILAASMQSAARASVKTFRTQGSFPPPPPSWAEYYKIQVAGFPDLADDEDYHCYQGNSQ